MTEITPEVGGAVRCCASLRGGAWSYITQVNEVSVTVEASWGDRGPKFTVTIPLDKLAAVMSKEDVDEWRSDGALIETLDGTGFYISTPAPDRS